MAQIWVKGQEVGRGPRDQDEGGGSQKLVPNMGVTWDDGKARLRSLRASRGIEGVSGPHSGPPAPGETNHLPATHFPLHPPPRAPPN